MKAKITSIKKIVEYTKFNYKKIYSIDTMGRKQGESILYYPNGRIFMKGFYKDDKLHGRYLAYYENGQVIIDNVYKNGQLIKQ